MSSSFLEKENPQGMIVSQLLIQTGIAEFEVLITPFHEYSFL